MSGRRGPGRDLARKVRRSIKPNKLSRRKVTKRHHRMDHDADPPHLARHTSEREWMNTIDHKVQSVLRMRSPTVWVCASRFDLQLRLACGTSGSSLIRRLQDTCTQQREEGCRPSGRRARVGHQSIIVSSLDPWQCGAIRDAAHAGNTSIVHQLPAGKMSSFHSSVCLAYSCP